LATHGSYFGEDFGKSDQYAETKVWATTTERLSRQSATPALDKPNTTQKMRMCTKPCTRVGTIPEIVFFVFLCRVVFGHPVKAQGTIIDNPKQPAVFSMGGSNYRQLASVPGSTPPHPSHSVVADPPTCTNKPKKNREFAIMQGNQIYPEFLVAYKRV
jgi:hypothetical protein